jgi:hypothetical protein
LTISSTVRKAGPFTGNGVTVAFPFYFKVFTTADVLAVKAVTATGLETTQTLGTNYTITLNADQNANPGGTLTMLVAPDTGETLTLTSQVANTQSVDLTNAGGFYPAVINTAFDKLVVLIQQLAEKLGRSIVLPVSSTASAQLPSPVPGSYIVWDGTGTTLTTAAGQATSAVSSAMAPVVAGATLADARTSMGAAASGANSDITSLNALTTPISLITLRGHIDGYQISPAGGSATLPIGAGVATDSTNTRLIQGAASNKTTGNWVVGSGNGGKALATAIANDTWYYIYAIFRPDTGVSDYCFSTNAAGLLAADFVAGGGNIPDAYTQWAYIGARLTDGSAQWKKCTQAGRTVLWDSTITNLNSGSVPTASRSTVSVSVPPARTVTALIRAAVGSGASNSAVIVSSPIEADQPATFPAANFYATASVYGTRDVQILTMSGQVAYRAFGVSIVIWIGTYGWIDNCGADA